MHSDSLKRLTEELLERLGIEAKEVSVAPGNRIVVSVISDDDRLVGKDGEHLRALNALARRIAEARHGSEAAAFTIDANGFHEAKLERVRDAARILAQRARLFQSEVEMEPMSSYERLVVHELFAEDPEIETASRGEGKARRIVLKYRDGK